MHNQGMAKTMLTLVIRSALSCKMLLIVTSTLLLSSETTKNIDKV